MKKKILALCVVVSLAAVAIIGGTLAYFTDTDTATNVFTSGDIKIELLEDFPVNKLLPGEKNALKKEVKVKNTGTEEAYLWIELWIPEALDTSADPSKNDLHFNPFDTYDVNGVPTPMRGAIAAAAGYTKLATTVEVPLGSKVIDGVTYNGYREYIENDTAKKTGEETYALLARVFMDKDVAQCTDDLHTDNCLVLKDGAHYDGSWEVIVNAFGMQAGGFSTIEEAIAAYNE